MAPLGKVVDMLRIASLQTNRANSSCVLISTEGSLHNLPTLILHSFLTMVKIDESCVFEISKIFTKSEEVIHISLPDMTSSVI